uniref:Uncharacterized protein n=2 Tax=Anguilla TaxID=7935 RepID=A0A0E9S4X8_ANGAN
MATWSPPLSLSLPLFPSESRMTPAMTSPVIAIPATLKRRQAIHGILRTKWVMMVMKVCSHASLGSRTSTNPCMTDIRGKGVENT